jgi:hypothetical protein
MICLHMRQCCQSTKRSGAFLGSEASGASFSKNPRKRSVLEASIIYIYINFYIYCVYIKKNMQKDKLVAECMKICIFVHCNIKMASIVVSSSTLMINHSSINHLESSNYKLTNQRTNF